MLKARADQVQGAISAIPIINVRILYQKIIHVHVAWAMSINTLVILNTNVYFHLEVKWKPI